MKTIFLPPAAAISLCGCALHPLPEDVAPIDTYAIVVQIRCEARVAVMQVGFDYLLYEKAPEEVLKLLRKDLSNITQIEKFYPSLSPEVRQTLDEYRKAALSLEFSFKMTEDDNLSTGAASIVNTFLTGADTFGLGFEDKHARKNFRNFRITESWEELALDNKNSCRGYRAAGDDFNYPISGNIGLYEVVNTYARLNQQLNLSAPGSYKGDNAFVDDLTFTTTVSGSFSPGHALNVPQGRSLLLKSASGTLGADRTDEHQLIVALYIPKDVKILKFKSNPRAAVTPKEITSQAIDRQITRRFFFGVDPFVTLEDLIGR